MRSARYSEIRINGLPLRVEVADTWLAVTLGLMFRSSLSPDAGMLFRMPEAADHAFHMWFVRFPLDIVFIDPDGLIVHIQNAAPGSWPFRSGYPVRYVLEVNRGWCVARGITVGDRCELSLK